jgi:hypothetical protein
MFAFKAPSAEMATTNERMTWPAVPKTLSAKDYKSDVREERLKLET